jgi:hypothetical protein
MSAHFNEDADFRVRESLVRLLRAATSRMKRLSAFVELHELLNGCEHADYLSVVRKPDGSHNATQSPLRSSTLGGTDSLTKTDDPSGIRSVRSRSRSPSASNPSRMRWSADETDALEEGFRRFPHQWENIRRHSSILCRFSGVQLKDKWRGTFGARAKYR